MNFVKDAMLAIHKSLNLNDKVDQVGEALTGVAKELRSHNDRILVLETRLNTIMELGQRQIPEKE